MRIRDEEGPTSNKLHWQDRDRDNGQRQDCLICSPFRKRIRHIKMRQVGRLAV